MVFIKMIKSVDQQSKKPYFLHSKVCRSYLVLVESETLHIIEKDKFVDYFYNFRLNFEGTYSLRLPLQTSFKVPGTYLPEVEVEIRLLSIALLQQEFEQQIQISSGKRLTISRKFDSPTVLRERDVLLVKNPTSLVKISSKFQQLIDFSVGRNLIGLQFKELILSYSLPLPSRIFMLFETNMLKVIDFRLSEARSCFEVVQEIRLDSFQQQFLGFADSDKLHGQRSVIQITRDLRLEECAQFKCIELRKPQSLESQEEYIIQMRNMRVYQLSSGWTFVNKKYNNFVVTSESIFRILSQLDISYLTLSDYKYKNILVLEQDSFSVEYKLMFVSVKEGTKSGILIYQYHLSSSLQCAILVKHLEIGDLKHEVDYIGVVSPYDILFKDILGGCGIIQFRVEELGEVLLEK